MQPTVLRSLSLKKHASPEDFEIAATIKIVVSGARLILDNFPGRATWLNSIEYTFSTWSFDDSSCNTLDATKCI